MLNRKKITEDIVKLLLDERNFTIGQICKKVGIVTSTYYDWYEKNAEFSDTIKRTLEIRRKKLGDAAEMSLARCLKPYKDEEVTKFFAIHPETGEKVLVNEKVVTKTIHPNPTLLIFELKNKFPEIYGDKNKEDGENTNNEIVIV